MKSMNGKFKTISMDGVCFVLHFRFMMDIKGEVEYERTAKGNSKEREKQFL